MIRIEVAIRPCPCLGCAVELALRILPLHRCIPPRQRVAEAAEEHVRLGLSGCHHHPLLQSHSLSYDLAGDEVSLGCFVRALLRKMAQALLKSGPEFPGAARSHWWWAARS